MTDLETTFVSLSRNFIAGDFAAVLSRFDLPVAIYAGDRVIICPTAGRFVETMARYRKLLVDWGVRDIEAKVLAVPLMRGITGTIWLEKTYLGADGTQLDSCQLRYFFRQIYGQTRISMIEYVTLPKAAASCDFGFFTAA